MSKVILTSVKNCQGQILIDQSRSEILEEILRYSFLVKSEGFSLQLYFQPNSITGIILLFFVILFLETPILGTIFWWPLHFMLIVKHGNRRENL